MADGYTVVNDAFAAAVVDEPRRLRPDAVVLLQDYHLYLVPRRVREQVPLAVLSHFVHIPWPEPEEWRVLPEPIRRELHESLLANDVVGFHRAVATRLRRLVRGRARSRGTGGCPPLAAPISVDAEEFEALAEPGRARPRGRAASAGVPSS